MSKNHKAGHGGKKGNVTPLPGTQNQLENPAKTFKVDPADIQIMAKFNQATGMLKERLSIIRYEYLKTEKSLYNQIQAGMEEMEKHEKMIKQKYKIIGEIKAFDIGKNEIYLK